MFCLLEQLNINFESEKIFDWCHGRIFDDYVEYNGHKIIIENHGAFHYLDTRIKNVSRNLKQEQENDAFKMRTALKNGIDFYFQIDCLKSDKEYIKNSIMESGLAKILNFSIDNVDWDKCDEFATSNLTKIVCEYWESHNNELSARGLVNVFHIAHATIVRYLHDGNKFGWCNYNPNLELRKGLLRCGATSRPVYNITTDSYYRNSDYCAEKYKSEGIAVNARNIRNVCLGKRNKAGEMTYIYITKEDFNDAKSNHPDKCHGDFFDLSNQQSA